LAKALFPKFIKIILHDLCNVKYFYTICVKNFVMKDKLKELRKEKEVSQAEVANAIGVSVSAYSNYEQGLREPSYDILKRLCKFFDVSADYLLGIDS